MLATRIDQIDEQMLSQLCSDERAESQTLDFKFCLTGKDEPAKVEFAKDVCAFANADGGEIVFGISDAQGKASAPCPIDTEAPDAAQRRLIHTIGRLIEPRIVGVQFHAVRFGKAGYILIVRVPQSFDGPHRFATDGAASRFVIRVGTMTQDPTYTQLRGAFDRTATLTARANDFRARRINAIKSGLTFAPGGGAFLDSIVLSNIGCPRVGGFAFCKYLSWGMSVLKSDDNARAAVVELLLRIHAIRHREMSRDSIAEDPGLAEDMSETRMPKQRPVKIVAMRHGTVVSHLVVARHLILELARRAWIPVNSALFAHETSLILASLQSGWQRTLTSCRDLMPTPDPRPRVAAALDAI